MSEFQDYEDEYQVYQNNQGFQSMKTQYFEFQDHVSNDQLNFSKKNDSKQTAQSLQNCQQEQNQTKYEQYFKEGLYFYQERKKNKIQYSHKTKIKYAQSKKGRSSETSDLTINFKALINAFFDQEDQESPVIKECKHQIQKYKKSESNITNLRTLFGVQEINNYEKEDIEYFVSKKSDLIRSLCIEQLSRKQVIEKILKNKKMNLVNKFVLIKHLEGLRKGCIYPEKFHKWKQS